MSPEQREPAEIEKLSLQERLEQAEATLKNVDEELTAWRDMLTEKRTKLERLEELREMQLTSVEQNLTIRIQGVAITEVDAALQSIYNALHTPKEDFGPEDIIG